MPQPRRASWSSRRARIVGVLIAATCAVALSGCVNLTPRYVLVAPDDAPTVPASEATTLRTSPPLEWTPPPDPAEAVLPGADGSATLHAGETIALVDGEGVAVATISVRGVTVDPVCPRRQTAPSNGHFVRIDLQAHALPELNDAMPGLYLGGWDVVDVDGASARSELFTHAALSCFDEGEQPRMILRRNEATLGAIVLDVPFPAGTLALRIPHLDGVVIEVPFE